MQRNQWRETKLEINNLLVFARIYIYARVRLITWNRAIEMENRWQVTPARSSVVVIIIIIIKHHRRPCTLSIYWAYTSSKSEAIQKWHTIPMLSGGVDGGGRCGEPRTQEKEWEWVTCISQQTNIEQQAAEHMHEPLASSVPFAVVENSRVDCGTVGKHHWARKSKQKSISLTLRAENLFNATSTKRSER